MKNVHHELKILTGNDKRRLKAKASNEIIYSKVTVKRLGNVDRIVCTWGVTKYNEDRSYNVKNSVNNEKLDNNLTRAKSKIKEYALCNEWTYFCTLTLSNENGDRYNLNEYKKKLAKWINNKRSNDNIDIKYLLIPEFHKDGAVHFHGLFNRAISEELVINQYGYLDWPEYHKSFGFISLSPIKDNVKVAYYITKYITKDISKHKHELGSHLYICSKGLKTGEVIYTDEKEMIIWDWQNEFCKVAEIDNSKEDYTDYISG